MSPPVTTWRCTGCSTTNERNEPRCRRCHALPPHVAEAPVPLPDRETRLIPIARILDWSLSVGRIAGIEIKLNVSLLFLALAACGMEILVLGILVFASLRLIHELAHAVTARLMGFEGGQFAIGIFGGWFIAEPSRPLDPNKPAERRAHLFMVAAGPLSNLLLAALTFGLAHLTQQRAFIGLSELNLIVGLVPLCPVDGWDGDRLLRILSTGEPQRRRYQAWIAASLTVAGLALLIASWALNQSSLFSLAVLGFIWGYNLYRTNKPDESRSSPSLADEQRPPDDAPPEQPA